MSQRHPATAAPGARTLSPRAISCITRPSSAGSIRTGWRTWLTIRSTGSCRSSNTFRLPENDLQLLASTFHPHLQRRNPRAGQLRHLLVFQVLDVLEEERLLQRFLRVLPVSEHVHGVAAEAITVPCDERAVRAGVARQDAAHQLSVARPHVLYTHRGSHNVTLPGGCDAGQGRRSILGRS